MTGDIAPPFDLRTAQWLGTHALLIWAGLAVLLVSVTLWSWPRLRHSARRRTTTQPAVAGAPGRRLAVGLALCGLSSITFAWLARGLLADGALPAFDLAFTDALARSLPDVIVHVAARLTRLGDPVTLGVLGVAVGTWLLWQRHIGLMLGWALALGGNGVLNLSLKHVFARVRPVHAADGASAMGFSFPSGHSSGTVVACGMLAYLGLRMLPPRWHLPVLLAALLLAFSVGISRIILRVHFASDVAAGFASGTAWLALCVTAIEIARWRRHRHAQAGAAAHDR